MPPKKLKPFAYVSPYAGGKGCARDIIEKVMKVQGKWMNAEAYSW
jgi:3-deoxy-D-manno-octulosonate 8-phosphate phosphatase (KDO 8-P phosphatase)